MDESLKRLYGEEQTLRTTLSELNSIVKDNNHRAKDIFKSIVDAQMCIDHTYSSLSHKEMMYLRDSIDPTPMPYDPHRQYHLGSMCSILSKYLKNIDTMGVTKGQYKKEITELVQKMFIQVEHIVKQDHDQLEQVSSNLGGMYHIQLDDITRLKTTMESEYSSRACRGITEINTAVKRYYRIIMDKLDLYTTLIKTKTIHSPDFTKILYQIRMYRILYNKLLLVVAHYRKIREELLITCGEDEKNRRYLVQCLTNMENVLRIETPI
jgi:hypothetical protein